MAIYDSELIAKCREKAVTQWESTLVGLILTEKKKKKKKTKYRNLKKIFHDGNCPSE